MSHKIFTLIIIAGALLCNGCVVHHPKNAKNRVIVKTTPSILVAEHHADHILIVNKNSNKRTCKKHNKHWHCVK